MHKHGVESDINPTGCLKGADRKQLPAPPYSLQDEGLRVSRDMLTQRVLDL